MSLRFLLKNTGTSISQQFSDLSPKFVRLPIFGAFIKFSLFSQCIIDQSWITHNSIFIAYVYRKLSRKILSRLGGGGDSKSAKIEAE